MYLNPVATVSGPAESVPRIKTDTAFAELSRKLKAMNRMLRTRPEFSQASNQTMTAAFNLMLRGWLTQSDFNRLEKLRQRYWKNKPAGAAVQGMGNWLDDLLIRYTGTVTPEERAAVTAAQTTQLERQVAARTITPAQRDRYLADADTTVLDYEDSPTYAFVLGAQDAALSGAKAAASVASVAANAPYVAAAGLSSAAGNVAGKAISAAKAIAITDFTIGILALAGLAIWFMPRPAR